MTPLITVLMPTLNAEKFLAEALESLAAQTLQDFKILVLDAASEDRTRQIACSFPRVEFIQCGRVGLGAQLRVGVERAGTPLAARMDADDISLPNRLESQATAMQDPALAIVGAQINLLIGSTVARAQPRPQPHAAIRRVLLAGFPAFCDPVVMFRTSLARRYRAYSVPGLGEELDFFLRMTEAGAGRNLPDVLHLYRLHGQSAAFTSFDELRRDYVYALACADARRKGLPEPDSSSHAKRWAGRGAVARLLTKAECFGVRLYRRSRIRMANGERIKGFAGAAVSVAMQPRLIHARALIALGALTGSETA